ncbi:MAG TPA: anti-sigma factor antagonist [Terriglobales bacterium]|nr:anti-sigma factor antagonist [Terriglobales bacterium]
MPLSLDTRGIGDVTIVRCRGRIVAGGEAEELRKHICDLLRDRRDIVLHLGEVVFIDSSGLGTIVRLLTSTRNARGDMKLCNLPPAVLHILNITSMIKLFETHASEEDAVLAFYHRRPAPAPMPTAGLTILCIDQSTDVLAYLRELLHSGGYNVLTSNNLHDSLILLKAARPHLTVLGPNLKAAPGTEQAFRASCAACQVVELGSDFSTLEAGEAASGLLEKIRVLGS